jgi:hypothetical protein
VQPVTRRIENKERKLFNLKLVFGNKYLKQQSAEENLEENLSVVSPECETHTPGCCEAKAQVECSGMKD